MLKYLAHFVKFGKGAGNLAMVEARYLCQFCPGSAVWPPMGDYVGYLLAAFAGSAGEVLAYSAGA
jgi:hypothetical protein